MTKLGTFYGHSLQDFVESKEGGFRDDDNYVPPSDDEKTSTVQCSDASDEDEVNAVASAPENALESIHH